MRKRLAKTTSVTNSKKRASLDKNTAAQKRPLQLLSKHKAAQRAPTTTLSESLEFFCSAAMEQHEEEEGYEYVEEGEEGEEGYYYEEEEG